jgi:hypothetical protein
VTAMCHSTSSRCRGTGGGKHATPHQTYDGLAVAMGAMAISSFQPFCFNIKYPFMVCHIPFVWEKVLCC